LEAVSPDAEPTQRLDVWLFRTRLFKTRSLAAKTISKGKLRLTRTGQTQRISKPHYNVRAGDGLSFMRGQTMLSVSVSSMPERRGPASEARAHYELMETANSSQRQDVDKSAANRHIRPS
jgi:ribosome-associated heat shock protein Hsp15